MTSAAARPHSLRRRLLGLVLAAILLAALGLGAATYRGALRQADALFDLHLQQMAQALRWGVPLGGLADGAADDGIEVLIQIWGLDGTLVFRSGPSPLPPRAVLGYSDAEVDGRRWRIYTLHTPMQTVQIAQDRDARQARARALALQATLPMALLAPLLMLAVGWIITRSLAPVERMRRQVAARADDDLSPLPEQGLPQEVRPLVHELNLLFGRVDAAFAAQKNFVADAAHELRSPLAALRLQVQALRRASDDASGREAAIARLQQGIERAIRLVGQMLVLARQEAGGEAAPVQPVALQALLQEAIGAALPQATARGIDLGLAAVEPATVQGRAQELLILLNNLVDNAIKYAPPGGRVDLGLALEDGAPVLTVEDSGPGIPEDQRERAFDRFHRLGSADEAAGSGLGLAIVRAIAQRHGASVRLDASARLGGLRAEVRWPRRP
ncbi:ATP-binding protein [Ramlibacter tataouinensis]|uniref:histidine kinase n=1 Tax=Ramlibacter tataouinensis (strain ATCC BAA-407 / DSM 14655 / LMG 21543 / TTB310) TaxID=365046 RepID=F5Y5U8_RAMTT|nr:ATP-binding protein [Ramlibacter tataouinensis]AEG93982.1 candidate histidine kinase, classic [Ramlibacter tataouinensis TTB310]